MATNILDVMFTEDALENGFADALEDAANFCIEHDIVSDEEADSIKRLIRGEVEDNNTGLSMIMLIFNRIATDNSAEGTAIVTNLLTWVILMGLYEAKDDPKLLTGILDTINEVNAIVK